MVKTRAVLKRMPSRDVVVWTSLIQGYVDNGESELGLELLESMDCAPNSRTLVAGLTACGNIGSSEAGRKIQTEFYRRGLEDDHVVGTCMVNFYGRCGRALVWISGSPRNALITGIGQPGNTSRVFEAFREMRGDGVRANAITFVSVITACSHGGLVERGREFFQAMDPNSGIVCGIHHYSSAWWICGLEDRPRGLPQVEERGSGEDCVRGTDEDRRERLGCLRPQMPISQALSLRSTVVDRTKALKEFCVMKGLQLKERELESIDIGTLHGRE
ncbi:pentatricopeptide repeat-containing protein At1g50270-like [Selaginella moellendorffii]|uniref:pentatricopeptide repeat-containing protein At1g50270-like n=1 Tax=Selaginella moellendorffii TaxID=88036 RepID=UPI000D1C8758|nr:pentatricopeptide repeat-containing protein At1g50270-like [Selaginella moellendorffii]|eukprot:XP_024533215.1 pentatricopeptide repeat-containing protein At1g50270-like [Selaginella moellendorffii]